MVGKRTEVMSLERYSMPAVLGEPVPKMNNMLTFEEVKAFLDLEQSELERLLQQGKLHAYKIGGTYIRFRKEEVINLGYEIKPSRPKLPARKTALSVIGDFWRFNNFYIVSLLIVILAVAWLVKSS